MADKTDFHIAHRLIEGCRIEFERGEVDALERAMNIIFKFKLAVPNWLFLAIIERLRLAESPRDRRKKEQREVDKVRAMTVLAQREYHGCSFEEAYELASLAAKSPPRIAGGSDAFKKSTDRFLKQNKVGEVIWGHGGPLKAPKKASGRIG